MYLELNVCQNPQEIYYVKPRSRGPEQSHSAGVLINKLRNFKRLISKTCAPEISDSSSQPNSLNGLLIFIIHITNTTLNIFLGVFEEDNTDVLWLKSHSAPWDEVCRRWKLTSHTRSIQRGQRLPNEIIDEWPVLKFPDALQLVTHS